MKVLVYFPRKNVDLFFEGAMLEHQIVKACKASEITLASKVGRDVDIANFINVNAASTIAIRNAIGQSIPTLLWLLWANNDNQARIIELTKDGKPYIPPSKLEIINMMDGVVVPTMGGRELLRKLKVKIPIFIVPGASIVSRLEVASIEKGEIFRRYFRINEDQKYTFSVMNVRAKKEIETLNKLALRFPDYNFYAFVSTSNKFIDRVRIKAMDRFTAKNLIVSPLVPEDVYRSGLCSAAYFIDLGLEKMNVMTLYEPMYLKVPLIIRKKVVFSEILSEKSAFIVEDYEGAAQVIEQKEDPKERVNKAFEYTQKTTEKTFSEAIINLFTKIYSR